MGNYECKISCFINFDAVSAANKHSACHKSRMASFSFSFTATQLRDIRTRASFLCGMMARLGRRLGTGTHTQPAQLATFPISGKKHTHTYIGELVRDVLRVFFIQVQVGIGFWSRWSLWSFGGFFLAVHDDSIHTHSKCCVKQLGDAGCWLRLNSTSPCSPPTPSRSSIATLPSTSFGN